MIVQIIHYFSVVQFLKLEVHFRHLLPQLGELQLLEYVVGEDASEYYKCHGDRGVPHCKFVSF